MKHISKIIPATVAILGCLVLVGCVMTSSNKRSIGSENAGTKEGEAVYLAGNPVEEKQPEEAKGCIIMEYEFYSADKEDTAFAVPPLVEEDGIQYRFTGEVSYEVAEIMEVMGTYRELATEDKEDISETIEYMGSNGKTYLLEVQDMIPWSEKTAIQVPVREEVKYLNQTEKPEILTEKEILYYDENTGKDEVVTGLLKDWQITDSRWQQAEPIKGIFTGNSENVSVWSIEGFQDVCVAQDAATPAWAGYEQDVVQILGLDSSRYRVTGARWDGAAKKEGEILIRKAFYDCEAYVSDYLAVYEGMRETIGYQAKVFYYLPAQLLDLEERNVGEISKLYRMIARATYEEIPEEAKADHEAERMELLETYQAYNPAVSGLIQIPGTVLNHPVMYTPEEEGYYLNRDLDGKNNSHGVPFFSLESRPGEKGGNSIIYGHNIRIHEKDVFGELNGYAEAEYYRQHPIIELTTATGVSKWLIFAYYLVDLSDENAFRYDETHYFQSAETFAKYMDEVKKRNFLQVPVETGVRDSYLTLSSCSVELSGSGSNRMVVMAKRLAEGEEYGMMTAQAVNSASPLLPDRLSCVSG